MGVVLTVVDGPRKGLEYRTSERTSITIGRSKSNDFRVRDASMSRVHAVVARDARGWYIEDCKSANGVWVDDVRTAGRHLAEEATFRLGDETVMHFRRVEAEDLLLSREVAVALTCARCGDSVPETLLVHGRDGRPFHLSCRDLDHLVGTALGVYRLIERVDSLGHGFYFRADQPPRKDCVTLAVFDAAVLARPGYRRALLSEVRRVSEFKHPNVLQIRGSGEAGATTFVVLEHFDGWSLADVLKGYRRVQVSGAVRVAVRTLSALRGTLAQGAVSSWVSSRRVLVSKDYDVKLWLFEYPDSAGREPDLVEAPYVAPEVLRGAAEECDERALVYSIGAFLYHMLSGIRAYEGATMDAITRSILEGHAPSLRLVNVKVKPALASAVDAALQRDPDARPQSLGAFESLLTLAAKTGDA